MPWHPRPIEGSHLPSASQDLLPSSLAAAIDCYRLAPNWSDLLPGTSGEAAAGQSAGLRKFLEARIEAFQVLAGLME